MGQNREIKWCETAIQYLLPRWPSMQNWHNYTSLGKSVGERQLGFQVINVDSLLRGDPLC